MGEWTEDMDARLLEMRREGLFLKQIALEFGLSRQALGRRLLRMNETPEEAELRRLRSRKEYREKHPEVKKQDGKWDDWQTDKLREMAAAGASYAVIAAELGFTRSACIGKARRIGLAKPKILTATAHRNLPRVCAPRGPRLRLVVDEPRIEVIPLNKTLMDLERNECRFIAGDPIKDAPGLYCGHPVHERSYCKFHFELCYVEPKRRWDLKRAA